MFIVNLNYKNIVDIIVEIVMCSMVILLLRILHSERPIPTVTLLMR